jgi:hypothetical protein
MVALRRDNAYYDKYFWVYPEKDRAHALDKGEAIKLLKVLNPKP